MSQEDLGFWDLKLEQGRQALLEQQREAALEAARNGYLPSQQLQHAQQKEPQLCPRCNSVLFSWGEVRGAYDSRNQDEAIAVAALNRRDPRDTMTTPGIRCSNSSCTFPAPQQFSGGGSRYFRVDQ